MNASSNASQIREKLPTAGPIGTKFGKHVQIHVGMDTPQTNCPSRHKGGLGGQQFKSLGKMSNGWTDWHQIWYTSADSSGNGHRLNTIHPSIPREHFRGSQIQKSWEAVKRLDRLAPNLAHMSRFIWEWIYAKQIAPRGTRGHLGEGFRGSNIQKFWEAVKWPDDWHQLWFTSADSSGNGHRLNTSRPSIPQGAVRGVLGGHKFKSLGKLSNDCTDWHQIWYTSADSSGNGHWLNTIHPTIPQRHLGGGGFRESQIKKSGKAVKRLDRLAPHLVHSCKIVWEWT